MWKEFHPNAEQVLATIALFVLAILSFLLVFFTVPASNKELITFVLGAISGALTFGGGGKKIADKFTSVTGNNTVAQPEEMKKDGHQETL